MRDFKGMKRQRGRNRSGGGGSGGGGGGGGGKPGNNINRAFDSNGPDNVKIRGHAQHVYEKYQQLARDLAASGDRVLAENYLQHAEHYFRVLRSIQPHRTVSEIMGRDAVASGFDIDFEDESGGQAEGGDDGEAQGEGGEGGDGGERQEQRFERSDRDRQEFRDRDFRRDERPRDERPRDDRPRDDRPRDDRPRDDRSRDERPRDDRSRDDRPRDDRSRDDRPRDDRPRDDRPRDDRPRDREVRRDDRGGYGQTPRRFGEDRGDDRPARDAAPAIDPDDTSPLLRSEDGDISHAPAFLQAAAPAAASEEGEARKPRARARRRPASFEPGEGPASGDDDA